MKRGLFIEITYLDQQRNFVESFKGTIRVDTVGKTYFECFRSPKSIKLKLRVFDNFSSIIVEQFPDNFFSHDFHNRKIIRWLGENAEKLVRLVKELK